MNKKIKFSLVIVLTVLLIITIPHPVLAAEETPTVKVAMSEDESIIVERILYTALKRIDYQMVTKTAGMRTMVNDVNYGDSAIVPAQTIGLDEDYPNLIRVPVPISYVEVNAYTRSDEAYEFSDWSELRGLRLSHCWKNLFVTRNVPKAEASEVVTLNEYEDLWNSLLANETDVAVIPNLTGFVRILPEGVKLAGVIQREPRYTYVNKDHADLVPLLTEAYQNMTDDGTMEQIRNSEQDGDKQVVLHISSYSSRVEWERSEIEAIREALELNNADIEYQNLNLNARQVTNKANMSAIINSTIRTNFIERNPDVIIVSDNDALDFVLNNYYMLFPKVPVVFCGINDFDISILHGFEEYVTGVSESDTSYETVTEMLRLYPNTQKIFILNDYTDSGLKWRDSLQKSLDTYDIPVEFEFNENKPFAEILTDIRGFDSDTLVLIGTYFLDGGKTFYTEQETQEAVSAASKTPVFCLASSYIGYGTLGGMVSVGETQGQIAGTMARQILMGTDISDIPAIIDSKQLNQWQFDYAVAQKFDINTGGLPASHTILNRKTPIWESNPFEYRLALTAIGLSLVIIIGLIVFLRLIQRKNKNLIEVQSSLHSAEEYNEKMAEIAEKEKEANMLKSHFLSNMSHEIRTPMNAIIGMAELLLNEPLSNRQQSYVDDIHVSSHSLLSIINDILDFSKIESGKLELTPVDYDFNIFIDNICSMFKFMSQKKGIEFKFEAAGKMPKCMFGDDVRLRQVLTNICGNAVKFTSEGFIRLKVTATDETLVFDIEDTGTGIRKEELPKLFEAFMQADTQRNRNIKGTGLGLSISKAFVEMMGGKISVDSEYGQGTVFTVTIPKVIGDENAVKYEEKTKKTNSFFAASAKILVVDDNKLNLKVASGLLNMYKINADTALSGKEAIRLIKETDYDIVFMDHMMPEMDGVETTEEIRRLGGKYKRLIIIALTANAVRGAKEMFLSNGFNDFISKPIHVDELAEKLREWLPREKIEMRDETEIRENEDKDNEAQLDFLSAVEKISGIEPEIGLSRISGSVILFRETMENFYRSMLGECQKLEDYLAGKDMHNFSISVHGLKSTLATIGATELSEEALVLETALKNEELGYCEEHFPGFGEKLRSLHESLSAVFPDEKITIPRPEGDAGYLRGNVKIALEAADGLDANLVSEAISKLLAYDFGEPTNSLLESADNAIKDFEFDAAVDFLNKILEAQ